MQACVAHNPSIGRYYYISYISKMAMRQRDEKKRQYNMMASKPYQPRNAMPQHQSKNSIKTATFPLEKKWGQHLLRNPGILDKIILASGIVSSDTVLEIGPGTGNLTMRLLPLARSVVAIDVDERMISELQHRVASWGYTNLKALHGDALRTDLGEFHVCTANLPYQISSPFLFRLLAHKHPYRCAVLMFQKEFAERLLAGPGDPKFCRLAANASLFCKVTKVCNVDRNSFRPPPKVDSMVVKITPRKDMIPVDFREWDGMLRICFGRKRRTLHSSFKATSVISMLEANYTAFCTLTGTMSDPHKSVKDLIIEVLEETNLSQTRAITIDIDTYFKLLLAFNKRGIHFVNVASSPNMQVITDAANAPQNLLKETTVDFNFMDVDEDSGEE